MSEAAARAAAGSCLAEVTTAGRGEQLDRRQVERSGDSGRDLVGV
jgi:hypothetical protein